jgi:hypothetical protein
MIEFITKYWLQVFFGASIAVLSKTIHGYKSKYDALKCSFNAMESVMIELSKSKMLDIYYEYRDEQCIPLHRLQSFDGLYNAYKALGGNGIITKKHEEVLNWEIEED